jgi:hypothetical protein
VFVNVFFVKIAVLRLPRTRLAPRFVAAQSPKSVAVPEEIVVA